jgi:hypothetical protein
LLFGLTVRSGYNLAVPNYGESGSARGFDRVHESTLV